MKTFVTVASMKLARLNTGQTVRTQGYYAAGDGAGAKYLIVAPQAFDGYSDHELADLNIAVLQYNGATDVRWFGAVLDGVTDDTTAIQTALDSFRNVYIPVGTAIVSPLTMSVNYTRLFGDGTLKLISSAPATSTIVTITGNYCEVEGISVDANSVTTSWAINSSDATGTFIHKVKGFSIVQAFIRAEGLIIDLTVTDCETHSLGYGVWLQDPDIGSSGLIVNNNRLKFIYGSGQGDGVEINAPTNGFSNAVISGNYISGYYGNTLNAGIGIGFANVTTGSITGNTIADCENDGIHIEDGSSGITISGNSVKNCCRTTTNASGGIAVLTSSNDISITGNTVIDSNFKPSFATIAANGTFNDNIEVIGNTFNGAYKQAVSIDSVRSLSLLGNIIEDADTSITGGLGAINVVKSGTNVSTDLNIQNNIVKDGANPVRSLVLNASSCTEVMIDGNNFRGCTTPSPDLGTGNNTELRANRLGTSVMSGTFTLGATATNTNIANTNTFDINHVVVYPTNAAAAALAGGHVSAVVKGTQFTWTTATAVGGETYSYHIV